MFMSETGRVVSLEKSRVEVFQYHYREGNYQRKAFSIKILIARGR